ncbi:MAG: hypothetical protein HGA45_13110 [Chloroflexales bacterium]|nr:hypothetical protein [Chloroflexales bacterium]
MATISSYVSYLPPALWSQEADPEQFLGRMLCIFEKILTGIDDGVPLGAGGRIYAPLEDTIDNLAQLFDPWRTRSDLLPWLATWVGVEALPPAPRWSEYQQRCLIAAIAPIFQGRGLKQDLLAYLDIFATSRARPRIAIDEGISLFRAGFFDDGSARLHPVAYADTVAGAAAAVIAPVHPTALAVDAENNYLVADAGFDYSAGAAVDVPPALWRIAAGGRITSPLEDSGLPVPVYRGDKLIEPLAVVVDGQQRYCLADRGRIVDEFSANAAIYRFAPPDYQISTIVSNGTSPALGVVRPVDMLLDQDERLLVLDRGVHLVGQSPVAARPKLVRVRETPLAVETFQLQNLVVEPTAMALQADGKLIIADAQTQSSTTPADLVEVALDNGVRARSLLADLPSARNPLVFPTSLVFESPVSLLVCDTGLRLSQQRDDPAIRALAEPAAIYRVDLAQSPPSITRVTRERNLVTPVDLALDRRGALIIADRGEAITTKPERSWRLGSHEFGVVVHFSRQRPTTGDERERIRRDIFDVIEAQKPAHTLAWMDR